MYRRIMAAVDETDAATRAVHEAVAMARAGVKRTTARVASDGGVGPTIVREAQRWTAGLIVVGTHGRDGIKRLLLGSVAEAVARAAEVPVLLVHGGGRHALPG